MYWCLFQVSGLQVDRRIAGPYQGWNSRTKMNCWQAGRLAGRKDGLWPRHFSGTRPQLTRVQTSGVHVGCGPRTKEKMGIWHGDADGDGDGGGYRHRLGESTGSWSRSSLRAEAQRADAAQTRSRIDEPENYFQIGDLIVI